MSLPITIKGISAQLGTGGNVILTLDHTFTSFTINAGATTNTGVIPNAAFTSSALAALQFLLLTSIDIIDSSLALGCDIFLKFLPRASDDNRHYQGLVCKNQLSQRSEYSRLFLEYATGFNDE